MPRGLGGLYSCGMSRPLVRLAPPAPARRRRHRSVADGDGLDLQTSAVGQPSYTDDGARGARLAEVLADHLVERRGVLRLHNVGGELGDRVQRKAGGAQLVAQPVERAALDE